VLKLPVLIHRGGWNIGVPFTFLTVVLIPLLGFFQERPGLLGSHLLVLIRFRRFLLSLLILWLVLLRLGLLWFLGLFLLVLGLWLVLLRLWRLILFLLLLLVLLLVLLLLVLVLVFRQELFNFSQEIVGLALVGQGSSEIGGFDLPERQVLQ